LDCAADTPGGRLFSQRSIMLSAEKSGGSFSVQAVSIAALRFGVILFSLSSA